MQVAPSRARGLKHLLDLIDLAHLCRALTGAWIETAAEANVGDSSPVAPSRARGLKLSIASSSFLPSKSRPHGRVD